MVEPCVIHIVVVGDVEFCDDEGNIVSVASSKAHQAIYPGCAANDVAHDPSLAKPLS